MPNTEKIGKKLRAAWRRKGCTLKVLSDAIGVYPQTIDDWFNDKYRPEPARLLAFAKVTGATMKELGCGDDVWIATGAELDERAKALAADYLRGTLTRIAAGMSPAAAFAETTQEEGAWTAGERRSLIDGAPALRAYLNQLAGGDWAALDPEEQRRLVADLLAQTPP